MTCIACITAPKPVPAERPICPRCGLYPVQRNWRGPSHQAFRSLCWSCSAPASADPDARHLRYLDWKARYQGEDAPLEETPHRVENLVGAAS